MKEALKPATWSVVPKLEFDLEGDAPAPAGATDEDTQVRRDPQDPKGAPAGAYRVWVNDNWSINVDARGHVIGPCFEGALGCVLQLTPAEGDNRLALKIPRMLADTVRENAFISQIVESEAQIVFKANERMGLNSGLIPVQLAQTDLLRGARQVRNSLCQDALLQEGCVIFVSFKKDGAPRFCNVRFEGDTPVVFPPAAQQDFAFLTREIWDGLRTPVMGGRRDFYEPTFFEVTGDGAGARARLVGHGRLSETMDLRQANTVWYAALPSILYNWASGTLQEAVSRGRHCRWTLVEHYDLICNVLRGLQTLHDRGLIHGDVRPANVMALGDTAQPSDYALGDYGSFSSDRARLGATPSSGHTMTGAGVSRLRTSVFYASERRNGVERESADVAIVLRDFGAGGDGPGHDEYFVHLGWRSSIVDPETNRPTPQALETMRGDWARMRLSSSSRRHLALGSDKLCKGDRLRIRDYIFTVIDSDDTYGRANFRCQRRFARVLHERIAIYSQDDAELSDGAVISVPVFTEIRQWSAATDLYGVGALALYTVFTSGLVKMKVGVGRGGDRAGPEHDPRASAETMLAEMIEMLESVPHFLYLWPDLEDFRATIESADDRMPSDEIAALPVVRHNHTPLRLFATQVVNNLLRGSPHVDALLHCFVNDRPFGPVPEYNVAHFLLFIHFVMSCLHRKTHLRRSSEGPDVNDEWLVCADRCEAPIPGGPASKALTRLRDLQVRCNRRDYDAFYVPADQFLKFDPRSDFQIRIELEQLRAEIQRRESCFRAHRRAAEEVAGTSGLRRKQHVRALIDAIERTPYGEGEGEGESAGGREPSDATSLAAASMSASTRGFEAVARAMWSSWRAAIRALKWPRLTTRTPPSAGSPEPPALPRARADKRSPPPGGV